MCVLGSELFSHERKIIRPMGNHGSKPRWTLIFLDREIHVLERAANFMEYPFFSSLKLFSRMKFLKQIIPMEMKGRNNVLLPQIS